MGCCNKVKLKEEEEEESISLGETRYKICLECPKITFHLGLPFCGVPVIGAAIDPETCGCMLHAKTKIKSQSCPLKKW